MSEFKIINGNCLDEMRKLPANSVDAIVSDPPYGLEFMGNEWDRGEGNDHPTVKPTELMRYLVRLVCAKGGTVLDPFMGSGSTGKGALLEDCKFIGIDLNAEYCKIADRRLSEVLESKPASLENLMQ